MLPKSHRLPSYVIRDVLRYGTRVVGPDITLIYRRIKNESGIIELSNAIRFTFIVSTKVDKRAVIRNRVRRILSESIRHLLSNIVPVECIVIGSKKLVGVTQVDVEKRVEDTLKKAGLLEVMNET